MRAVRRVLVVLLVLGVLAVVADRVAVWAAQGVIADRVATELDEYQVDSAPPEVDVRGFPFLTQVASGSYGEVLLRLRDVGSGGLRLSQVELTATGVAARVTALTGSGEIRADRLTGVATIGYAQVVSLTGRPELTLTPEDGDLVVRLPVELAGAPVTLVGTADVEVGDRVVRIRVPELTAEGGTGIPPGAEAAVEAIAGQLSVDVPLPPLPYQLSVESVRAGDAGIVVTVSAVDVPLSR